MLHKMVLLKDVPKVAILASNAKIGTAYSRAIWPNGQKWNWEYPESHVALLYYWLSLIQRCYNACLNFDLSYDPDVNK